MRCPKWIKSLWQHMSFGVFTDFPEAEETDPNEPLRDMEPREMKGVKFKWKF